MCGMYGFPMSLIRYTRNIKFQVFLLRDRSPCFSDAQNSIQQSQIDFLKFSGFTDNSVLNSTNLKFCPSTLPPDLVTVTQLLAILCSPQGIRQQWSSNLNLYQNLLGGLLEYRLPPLLPEFLVQYVWSGTRLC